MSFLQLLHFVLTNFACLQTLRPGVHTGLSFNTLALCLFFAKSIKMDTCIHLGSGAEDPAVTAILFKMYMILGR